MPMAEANPKPDPNGNASHADAPPLADEPLVP
jgi:hypothetical protein